MGRLVGIARRERKRAAMQLLDEAEVSTDSGVANDFRGRPGGRQVTVLAARVWRQVCRELGRELAWTTRRANLLVDDIDLPNAAGDLLEIGALRLRITLETNPCSRMEEQCAGLVAALQPDWRGGVCCSVEQGGTITLGDPVRLHRGGALLET